MVMATVSADVLVPRLEEKHEEPQEKKQKKTDEEKQEEKEDVPYHDKVGLPLDDELLSDDDDDDDDCFPGKLPEMTRAELALYHQ